MKNLLIVFLLTSTVCFAADTFTVTGRRLADEAEVSSAASTNYVVITTKVGTNNVIKRISLINLNNEINIKHFGALGGGADSTDAIQSAIDYAVAIGGAKIRIPAGTYLINTVSNSLRLTNGVSLVGDTGTKFTMNATTNDSYAFVRIWNSTNCSVSGIIFYGDRSLQTNLPAGFGISVRNSDNVVINDCTGYNIYGDAVYIGGSTGSRHVTVMNSYFTNSVRNNISIVNGSNINVINSKFLSANYKDPQAGIDVEPNTGNQIEDVLIFGNDFIDNKSYGLYLNRGAGNHIRNVQIVGNKFRGNNLDAAAPGVKVNRADNVLLANNVSENNDYGYYIAYSTNVNFVASVGSHNTYDGITLEGSENVNIESCTFSKNGRNGVLLTGSVSGWPYNVSIVGSSISENTERAISVLAGSSPMVSKCTISLNGQDGVWVQDCSDPVIQDNYIAGQSQAVNNTYAGIRLAGIVYGARVSGNTVRKSPRWFAGTATGGDTNTIVFPTNAVPKTNFYAGYDIVISSGTGSGQRNRISVYNQVNYTATTVTNWTISPDNTSVYEVQLTNYQANSIRIDSGIADSIVIDNDVRYGGTWSVPTNSYLMAGNVGVSLPYFIVGGTDLSDTYLSIIGGNSKMSIRRNGYDKEAMVYFNRSGTDEWKVGSSSSTEFLPAGAFTIAKADTTNTPAISVDTSLFVGFHTDPTNAAQVSIADNNAQLRLEYSDSVYADFWMNAGLSLNIAINGFLPVIKLFTNHTDIVGLRLPGYTAAVDYVWTCTNSSTGAGHWTSKTGDPCAITNITQVGVGSKTYSLLVSSTNSTWGWRLVGETLGEWPENNDADFNLIESDDVGPVTDDQRGVVANIPTGSVGGYLRCDSTNEPNFSAGEFTISFWVKPDELPDADNRTILSKKSSYTASGSPGYMMVISNDARIHFKLQDTNDAEVVVVSDPIALLEWSKIDVRGTLSGADLTVDLFLNGTNQDSVVFSSIGSTDNAEKFYLGTDGLVVDLYLGGYYSDLKIWNYALTDCAIESDFTGCLCEKTVQVKSLEPGNGIVMNNEGTKIVVAIDSKTVVNTIVTNYPYASDLVLPMLSDVRGSVTNAVGGNVNLLVTNIIDGAVASVRLTADGTPRTVSLFWPDGVTVVHLTTNATINATNLYIPANKTGMLDIRCSGTNFVTVETISSP